jgi:hypothetical protein
MVKDFKLGESFQLGRTKLEVRKESGCENCFFYELMENCREVKRFVGNCEAKKREDKTEVSFVEID